MFQETYIQKHFRSILFSCGNPFRIIEHFSTMFWKKIFELFLFAMYEIVQWHICWLAKETLLHRDMHCIHNTCADMQYIYCACVGISEVLIWHCIFRVHLLLSEVLYMLYFTEYCNYLRDVGSHWKFETNIPRKGIARPQSQFPHSFFCERFTAKGKKGIYRSRKDRWKWRKVKKKEFAVRVREEGWRRKDGEAYTIYLLPSLALSLYHCPACT